MIVSPHIVTTQDQLTAFIPMVIPRGEMRDAIGPAIQELIRASRAQGLNKTGPWFAHHLSFSETEFDFEVSIPVSGHFKPSGRAIPGIWPAGTVARTTVHGDYSQLVGAWNEFRKWIDAQALHRAPHIYEVYTVTPATTSTSAEWMTELNWPLLPRPEKGDA